MSPSRARAAAGLLLAAAAAAYWHGGGWGLPAKVRFDAVLLPEQRNDEFYASVEANRRALYQRIGENVQAAFGRGDWSGETEAGELRGGVVVHPPGAPAPALMHGFSSFALRSVEQDEQFALNALARFKPRKLDFNPRSSNYGGAYLYPLAGWLGAAHVLGLVTLKSDPLFYYRDTDRIGRLYRAGRALSVLSALGCVALLLLIGRENLGEEAALWGAALFAFAPAVDSFAHVLKPHLSAAFYGLACALFGLRWSRDGRRVDALKAGVLLGLAVGTAKNYALLGGALAVLGLLAPLTWKRRLGDLAAAALLSVAVFFLANPYTLANWKDFVDESRVLSQWYRPQLTPAILKDFLLGPWRLGAGALPFALGLAGLVAGLARPTWRRLALVLAVLLLGTAYAAGYRSVEAISARFFFPGLGLGALLGAALALSLPGRALWAGRAVLLAALLALGAECVAAHRDLAMGAPGRSNADAAGRWMSENLPAGAALGFDTPAPMGDRFPPVPFSRYAMTFVKPPVGSGEPGRLPRWFAARPDWPHGERFSGLYAPVKEFDALGRRDPFTQVNFPVTVYELRTRAKEQREGVRRE